MTHSLGIATKAIHRLRATLQRWVAATPPCRRRDWAVVLDIDDTLVVSQQGVIVDGRDLFCKPIPGAVELMQDLVRWNITALLVTARCETARALTEQQLADLGMDTYTQLHMHNWGSDGCIALWKRRVREALQRRYAIIAAVGDQVFDVDTHAALPVPLPWCPQNICSLRQCPCGLTTRYRVMQRLTHVLRRQRDTVDSPGPPPIVRHLQNQAKDDPMREEARVHLQPQICHDEPCQVSWYTCSIM